MVNMSGEKHKRSVVANQFINFDMKRLYLLMLLNESNNLSV